jgi:DNA-binding protein YbaB
MGAIGGSVESVGINGRLFPATADADVSRKLGGFEVEVQANGDGTARKIKTRVPWLLDGVALGIDDDRGDQEFLQDIADSNEFAAIEITLANGVTFMCEGTVSGEIQGSTQNGVVTVSLSGPGKLSQ